ncbi:histidine phosphatase family protein [cyanobacterium endosymbiont of Epithemia clementina EcSB]|uniref:histidine phosphatase family protein n=1 Tax=cyanobacterium endosymbiont of Epithemia clementina EcSB TaxID=3034674 RepID=UPI0024808F4D|nr:histidine phosphatase family protein [cyanobacterium endosymbiont of Epithemia clementina EcSB]WGT68200.1 histidine phosphatase family protein [cyanobacterium endosymbiont of Epithemia clementina EcSB]
MATRVIIVRHGQSNYNAEKLIQGRNNESVLTEKGRRDAQKVGDSLSLLPIDAMYCSPLQRAKATAEIIHSRLLSRPSLSATNQLMEIDLPLWEKQNKLKVAKMFKTEYQSWKERPHEFKMILSTSEGKKEHFPVLALYQQANKFWQEMIPQHQGKTLLIVAHNGINRCLIMSAIGVSPERYHSIQQSNCCINILNFSGNWGESVQLESLNQTSHLGIPIPSTRSDKNHLRFFLVRHGETEWNRESRFQGVKDISLNKNGQKQAKKTAYLLKEIPLNFAVSSPMLRPKETAQIILQYHKDVELELKSQLQEICHGLWEGKLASEIEVDFPGLLTQWKDSPETLQMPEGENLQQVWDRATICWNQMVENYSKSPESKIGIVVAHDAINKVILCYLLGLKTRDFWNIKQGNGGVSVIDYPRGIKEPPVLQAINLTSHLGSGILDQTVAGAL